MWSTKQILHQLKLVLLVCLRDPAVQEMSNINHLLQSFCIRDMRAAEVAAACSDYLLENKGKDIAFLFDGYDEYPEALQKESLISDRIKRKVLSHCGLIISSWPHASVNLHKQATVRVDIMGFTASGVASLHRLVGHKLGLPIWLDCKVNGIMSSPQALIQLNKLPCWSILVIDFIHSVSNYSHYSLLK